MYSYNNNFQPGTFGRMDIVRVNGEAGARAFQMPANSSVLLLDDTAPIVWLKQTDGAGYPSLSPYSITPYKAPDPVDVRSLEERIKILEDRLNESNHSTAE